MAHHTLGMGFLSYTSRWIVADCRYGVLLRMLCHEECNAEKNYKQNIVKVLDHILHAMLVERKATIKLCNLGFKLFRKMLRGPKAGTLLYHFAPVSIHSTNERVVDGITPILHSEDKEVQDILEEFKDVLHEEPPGLTPAAKRHVLLYYVRVRKNATALSVVPAFDC